MSLKRDEWQLSFTDAEAAAVSGCLSFALAEIRLGGKTNAANLMLRLSERQIKDAIRKVTDATGIKP